MSLHYVICTNEELISNRTHVNSIKKKKPNQNVREKKNRLCIGENCIANCLLMYILY